MISFVRCLPILLALSAAAATHATTSVSSSLELEPSERRPEIDVDYFASTAAIDVRLSAFQDTPARRPSGEPYINPTYQDAAASFGQSSYGDKGTRRWRIHGAVAWDIDESANDQYLLGGGISWFIEENLSLDFELNGLIIDQRGESARALNLNLLLRWHFLDNGDWTLFADGGAGLLFADSDVPDGGGSHFNFTPQFGLGLSMDIGNQKRLLAGVRWHHISNANLYPPNPGRDNVMFWAGVSFPF